MQEEGSVIKIAENVVSLCHNLAGPLAEEVGLILADKVRVYRVKNCIETFQKTDRMLREANLPPSAVHPRLLLPIVENCSVEDDDYLQELWAGLLASASQQEDAVSPSFIETLKQLTPAEANHLEQIYEALAERRRLKLELSISPYLFTERGGATPGVSPDVFERLGLIRRDFDVRLKGPSGTRQPNSLKEAINSVESEMRYQFIFTSFALSFLEACHGPRADSKNMPES